MIARQAAMTSLGNALAFAGVPLEDQAKALREMADLSERNAAQVSRIPTTIAGPEVEAAARALHEEAAELRAAAGQVEARAKQQADRGEVDQLPEGKP